MASLTWLQVGAGWWPRGQRGCWLGALVLLCVASPRGCLDGLPVWQPGLKKQEVERPRLGSLRTSFLLHPLGQSPSRGLGEFKDRGISSVS